MAEGEEVVVVTRNTPTTYYFEGDRASGFEYGLIRAFAREYNMPVRIKVAFSLPELFEMLASGEAHLAAAGLSQSAGRDAHFVASNPYLYQQPLVVYKSGALRPRSLDALAGRDIVVVAGSVHVETLSALQQDLPELTWREIHAADSLELMQLVTDEKADLAIVDSIEFSIQQQLLPRVVAAMEIGDDEEVQAETTAARELLDELRDQEGSDRGGLAAFRAAMRLRGLSRVGRGAKDGVRLLAEWLSRHQVLDHIEDFQWVELMDDEELRGYAEVMELGAHGEELSRQALVAELVSAEMALAGVPDDEEKEEEEADEKVKEFVKSCQTFVKRCFKTCPRRCLKRCFKRALKTF